MTVTRIEKDAEALTMHVHAEFDATVERTWQLWADPRKLERWWGPPTHPATFTTHELRPGGRVAYYMTGPEGEQYHGIWDVREVDAPNSFSVDDSFADSDGNRVEQLPTTSMRVELTARDGGGTRVLITSRFPSLEAMDQVIAMGMEEGLRQAMGQMDAVLETVPA